MVLVCRRWIGGQAVGVVAVCRPPHAIVASLPLPIAIVIVCVVHVLVVVVSLLGPREVRVARFGVSILKLKIEVRAICPVSFEFPGLSMVGSKRPVTPVFVLVVLTRECDPPHRPEGG